MAWTRQCLRVKVRGIIDENFRTNQVRDCKSWLCFGQYILFNAQHVHGHQQASSHSCHLVWIR